MKLLAFAFAFAFSFSSPAQTTDTIYIDSIPYMLQYDLRGDNAILPAQDMFNTVWLLENMSLTIDYYHRLVPHLQTDIALADSTIASQYRVITLQEARILNLQDGMDGLNRTLDECQALSDTALRELSSAKKSRWWMVGGGVVVGVLVGVLVANN